MDEKTVVVRRRKPAPAETGPGATKQETNLAQAASPNMEAAPGGNTTRENKQPVSVPILILVGLAVLLIGFGSALTTIYLLSPDTPNVADISAQDLSSDIVAIQSEEDEKEDEALIRAATQPRILDLSGDPVIVRQLSVARRQLLKLAKDEQRKAGQDLGVRGDLYRFKDILDVPDSGLAAGVIGSQEDVAVVQPVSLQSGDTDSAGPDAEEGTTVIFAGRSEGVRFSEFAQQIQERAKLAVFLANLGIQSERATQAESAFKTYYDVGALERGDRIAVRAVSEAAVPGELLPVQISIYRDGRLVGTIALNDIDVFTKAEDPWYGRDIFAAPLLPDETNPEDRPRLLDAIYAAALRNRLETAIVGEAIMLMSRTFDLEQKVQAGDTITLIYSPAARDARTGLGRIVYINVGRTTGDLECYVVQSPTQPRYECASGTGETTVAEGGMVMPVNGIIVARFGPQGQSDSGEGQMNFGVDWTAPKGSPVVAAFAGQVTAVGMEDKWGMVVRLSHDDGKTTMYGYLQRVPSGIAIGSKVAAGQVIAYVGTPSSSREPRLHFELQRNGVPVDPVGEMQSSVGSGSAVDQFVGRIIHIESANRCDARNPLSTAVGLGQFIESTWMTTIRLHRPDLLQGRTRQQVLDLRTNCELARAMTTAFTRDNAAVLRKAGHSVTPGNLYLAHFLGVGGATKALRSHPNTQIIDVFGAAHVRANPFEQGKTIGYLIAWAAKKMGSGKAPPPGPATAGGPTETAAAQPTSEPLTRYEADPAFAKLKSAVAMLLQ